MFEDVRFRTSGIGLDVLAMAHGRRQRRCLAEADQHIAKMRSRVAALRSLIAKSGGRDAEDLREHLEVSQGALELMLAHRRQIARIISGSSLGTARSQCGSRPSSDAAGLRPERRTSSSARTGAGGRSPRRRPSG